MLTRQRISSVFSLGLSLRLLYRTLALCACLLTSSACDPTPNTAAPLAPAVNVPHGMFDITTNTTSIAPRARTVAALQSLALENDMSFYELQGPEGSIAALLAIDLVRFEPLVLTNTAGITPKAAISQDGIAVIIGSSFVSQVRMMEPIGLLQRDGATLQAVEQHGYTRILGITAAGSEADTSLAPGRFAVLHRSQWQPNLFQSALQAGPGIIEQGLLDISERDLQRSKYFRSFVAACGDTAVVGATLIPAHLYTLGQALVDFFAQNNLACNEVVNLAGDREAVMLVRSGTEAAFLGDPQPRKVALIGFKQRAGYVPTVAN